MITQDFVIDGTAINEIFNSLVSTVTEVFLTFLVMFFQVFFDYFIGLIGGVGLGSNPAVYLIAIAIIFTAYMIWRSA